MTDKRGIDALSNQGIAAYVGYLTQLRVKEFNQKMSAILRDEANKITEVEMREFKALHNINHAQADIDAIIDVNRGGENGVHGFIAEFAEVGIRNASRSLKNMRNIATVINDNGPADLHIGKHDVQVKFYNNIINEIKQASGYRDMQMMYPKDHVEVIEKIMNGERYVEFNGGRLSQNTIDKIRALVEEESTIRGETYMKWISPANLSYDEVQKNAIHETLEHARDDIKRVSDKNRSSIELEAREKALEAREEVKPSFGKASQAATVGMAVQGGVKFAHYVYEQHKNGKEIWEFAASNWKEAGIESGKGAVKGGITGYAIYGLTNVCHLSAPSAGAITSGTFGLINSVVGLRKGKLSDDEFMDSIIFNAMDSTGAAFGATIGQAVIPVPIVGAVVGSIAMTSALSLGKGILNEREERMLKEYAERINAYMTTLDDEYQCYYNDIVTKYAEIGDLQTIAFDLDNNISLRFETTVQMAKKLGVPQGDYLGNIDEIENYFS